MQTAHAVCPHVRYMIRRDLPEVLAIEAASFEYAWAESDFLQILRGRNSIGMVAEVGEQVIGFMVYTVYKRQRALELANFAVAKDWRRRGVGSSLVEKLKGRLNERKLLWLQLVLRETNLSAQLFFRRHGFRAVQTMPGFFEDSGEDGYVLQFASDAVPAGHNRIAGLDAESCA